jgi:hypothetical protein
MSDKKWVVDLSDDERGELLRQIRKGRDASHARTSCCTPMDARLTRRSPPRCTPIALRSSARAVKGNLVELGLGQSDERVSVSDPLGFDSHQRFAVSFERDEVWVHDKLDEVDRKPLVRLERRPAAQRVMTVGIESRDGSLFQERVDLLDDLWFSQRHAR